MTTEELLGAILQELKNLQAAINQLADLLTITYTDPETNKEVTASITDIANEIADLADENNQQIQFIVSAQKAAMKVIEEQGKESGQ